MSAAQRRRQRGAALLLAMIIVALVASATAGMVWLQTQALQVESAERARTQAAWVLAGALDWAGLILREDRRSDNQRGRRVDALDEPWATPLAEARLSSFLAADKDNNAEGGPEAFISGSITDAQSRFNLRGLIKENQISEKQLAALQRLCTLAGTPSDTAARIAKALLDAHLAGGEGQPGAPLAPARLGDLAWSGIDAATLARLAPWADLLPEATAVNVNTAPAEVLLAAIDGIDPGGAETLVQQRQRKPFDDIAQIKLLLPSAEAQADRVAVGTTHFTVSGRLRLDERVLEEQSLLKRDAGSGAVQVLRRERRSLLVPAGGR